MRVHIDCENVQWIMLQCHCTKRKHAPCSLGESRMFSCSSVHACASEHAIKRKWVMRMFSCISSPHLCYGLYPFLSMQAVMTRGEIQFCISERPHEQYADSYQSTEKNCVLTVELQVSTSRIFSKWLSTICRWHGAYLCDFWTHAKHVAVVHKYVMTCKKRG